MRSGKKKKELRTIPVSEAKVRTSPRKKANPILGWARTPPKIKQANTSPRRKSRSQSKQSKQTKTKTETKPSTPEQKMWKHVLTLAFIFAIVGGCVAFVTPNSPSNDDPYTVLELQKSDILELDVKDRYKAIKSAYRQLSRKYHPDRPGGSDTKFIRLTESYEKLASLDSGYVPDSSNSEANEELEKTLKEAKKMINSVFESKLLRCVLIGGALGLVVGSMSKHLK